jgi:hypothetical protein
MQANRIEFLFKSLLRILENYEYCCFVLIRVWSKSRPAQQK